MKVESTGLGKTVLISHISHIEPKNELFGVKELMLEMGIEATSPVHWKIKCYLEPVDVLRAARLVLKPKNLGRILRMLFKEIFSGKRKNLNDTGNKTIAENGKGVN